MAAVWSAAAAFVVLLVAKVLYRGVRVEIDVEHGGNLNDHDEEAYGSES